LSTKVKLRDAVLGAWELVSYTIEDSPSGDTTYPLGPHPVGLIMYTEDGYMSAQLMRPDRPAFDSLEASGGTRAAESPFATGYLAYSGPFHVDEATGALHHQVKVSLFPAWLGSTQLRCSRLEGDTLTLSGTNTFPNGATSTHTLLWQRAPRQ
jgi:lipocalin-like protein